jgi:hypothetical protein
MQPLIWRTLTFGSSRAGYDLDGAHQGAIAQLDVSRGV